MKKVMIERAGDGTYSAYVVDDMPYGVMGTGKTAIEAREDFMNSYAEMKEFFEKEGMVFEEFEFEFAYDMSSFLSYYSKILSLAGLERLTGVNQGQLSHYVTGHRKPSKKTVEKIESRLKAFAEDLQQVQFV